MKGAGEIAVGLYGKGDGTKQLNYPTGIAVSSEQMFIADTGNKRVIAFRIGVQGDWPGTIVGLKYNTTGASGENIFVSLERPFYVAVNPVGDACTIFFCDIFVTDILVAYPGTPELQANNFTGRVVRFRNVLDETHSHVNGTDVTPAGWSSLAAGVSDIYEIQYNRSCGIGVGLYANYIEPLYNFYDYRPFHHVPCNSDGDPLCRYHTEGGTLEDCIAECTSNSTCGAVTFFSDLGVCRSFKMIETPTYVRGLEVHDTRDGKSPSWAACADSYYRENSVKYRKRMPDELVLPGGIALDSLMQPFDSPSGQEISPTGRFAVVDRGQGSLGRVTGRFLFGYDQLVAPVAIAIGTNGTFVLDNGRVVHIPFRLREDAPDSPLNWVGPAPEIIGGWVWGGHEGFCTCSPAGKNDKDRCDETKWTGVAKSQAPNKEGVCTDCTIVTDRMTGSSGYGTCAAYCQAQGLLCAAADIHESKCKPATLNFPINCTSDFNKLPELASSLGVALNANNSFGYCTCLPQIGFHEDYSQRIIYALDDTVFRENVNQKLDNGVDLFDTRGLHCGTGFEPMPPEGFTCVLGQFTQPKCVERGCSLAPIPLATADWPACAALAHGAECSYTCAANYVPHGRLVCDKSIVKMFPFSPAELLKLPGLSAGDRAYYNEQYKGRAQNDETVRNASYFSVSNGSVTPGQLVAAGLMAKGDSQAILASYDANKDGKFEATEFMNIPQYCLPLPCADLNFSDPAVAAKNFAPVMGLRTSQMLATTPARAVICQTGYRGSGSVTCSSEMRKLDLETAFCSPNRCLDPPRAVTRQFSKCTTGCGDAVAYTHPDGTVGSGPETCTNISHGAICAITCQSPFTPRGDYVCELGKFRSTRPNEPYPMCIMQGEGFRQYLRKVAIVVSALTISSSGLFDDMDRPDVQEAMVRVVENITLMQPADNWRDSAVSIMSITSFSRLLQDFEDLAATENISLTVRVVPLADEERALQGKSAGCRVEFEVEVSSAEERDRVFTLIQDISPARDDFLAVLIKKMLILYTPLTAANLTDLTAACDDPVLIYREETVIKEEIPPPLLDNAIFMVLGSTVAVICLLLCGAGNYYFRKTNGRIMMEDEEIGLNDIKLEEVDENGHTNGHANGHTNGK
jgi:hypothetical protein